MSNQEKNGTNINEIVVNINKTFSFNELVLKSNSYLTSLIEIHRVFVSSFLIAPRICGNTICNLENIIEIYKLTKYSYIIFAFNFITLIVFILLYFYEMRRENILLDYLRYDKMISISNKHIELFMRMLPKKVNEKILRINLFYKKIATLSIIFFILNTAANSYILYTSYNNPTLLILITNTFFMGTKLGNTYTIINTDKFIFYSAFFENKYQYNDINEGVIENIGIQLDEIETKRDT